MWFHILETEWHRRLSRAHRTQKHVMSRIHEIGPRENPKPEDVVNIRRQMSIKLSNYLSIWANVEMRYICCRAHTTDSVTNRTAIRFAIHLTTLISRVCVGTIPPHQLSPTVSMLSNIKPEFERATITYCKQNQCPIQKRSSMDVCASTSVHCQSNRNLRHDGDKWTKTMMSSRYLYRH